MLKQLTESIKNELGINEAKKIIAVLSGCIAIVGIISMFSDSNEKQKERRDVRLKKYTKKDPNRKETLAFYDALKEISQKEQEKG